MGRPVVLSRLLTPGRAVHVRQALRFVLVGVCNTLLGYGLIFGFMYGAGLGPIVSNALGYGLGLAFAFLLHRTFTFRSTGRYRTEVSRFLLVFGVAYSLNLLTLATLTRVVGLGGGVSQVGAGAVYVVGSFLMSKFFVFADRRRERGPADAVPPP